MKLKLKSSTLSVLFILNFEKNCRALLKVDFVESIISPLSKNQICDKQHKASPPRSIYKHKEYPRA